MAYIYINIDKGSPTHTSAYRLDGGFPRVFSYEDWIEVSAGMHLVSIDGANNTVYTIRHRLEENDVLIIEVATGYEVDMRWSCCRAISAPVYSVQPFTDAMRAKFDEISRHKQKEKGREEARTSSRFQMGFGVFFAVVTLVWLVAPSIDPSMATDSSLHLLLLLVYGILALVFISKGIKNKRKANGN